jgi:hypothetical protein
MPTMRLSSTIATNLVAAPDFSAGMIQSETGAGTPVVDNPYPFGGRASGFYTGAPMRLNIYKGTPATFPDFTDITTRSSDLLISFVLLSGTNVSFQILGIFDQKARFLISKCLTLTAATGSGTATWLLAFNDVAGGNLTNRGALLGSVGLPGSGADLQIPNIEIASGSNYQCAGFYINMPQNWTV